MKINNFQKNKKSCYILDNHCHRKHDFTTIYPSYMFYLRLVIPVFLNWYGCIFTQLLNLSKKLSLNHFPATSGEMNVFSISKLCLQLHTSIHWPMLSPFPWVAVLHCTFSTDTQMRAVQSDSAAPGREDAINNTYREKHSIGSRMENTSGCLDRSLHRISQNKSVRV